MRQRCTGQFLGPKRFSSRTCETRVDRYTVTCSCSTAFRACAVNTCRAAWLERATGGFTLIVYITAQQENMWSIGILIAGSLYWSTEPYRVTWRGKFLNMNRVIPVRAPIRCGRKSRHGSYTMVFAPGGPMGQAKVVACQSHATSIVDI